MIKDGVTYTFGFHTLSIILVNFLESFVFINIQTYRLKENEIRDKSNEMLKAGKLM